MEIYFISILKYGSFDSLLEIPTFFDVFLVWQSFHGVESVTLSRQFSLSEDIYFQMARKHIVR